MQNIMQRSVDFYLSSGQYVHLVRDLPLLEDFLVLIENVKVENDGELIQNVFRQVVHVMDVSHLFFLPDLVYILVSEEVFLQARAHFWEHEDHLVIIIVKVANHCINLWTDACTPRLFVH